MKKKICSICLVSLAMLAFAPLNTGAKALEDSFYSEEQVEESTGISDFLEKDSDDFTSGDEEITDSFSSQIEEQVESNNDESNNDWTPLDNESKISFKYDSETKVLSFKASEPAALPDNTQDGSTSNWYLKNAEVANAVTIEIGDNITKIGENNFDNHLNAYPNIKNVILASSVKEIGYAAFYKVSSLQSINLESVETLGQAALSNTSIEKVSFEKPEVTIGKTAFSSCGLLKEVTIKGKPNIGDSAFEKCSQLNSFVCDSPISKIGAKAFMNCSELSSFKAESITEIGNYSFQYCTNLNQFDFSGTESIGRSAFASTAIVNVDFSVLKKIGRSAFSNCSNLASICYYGSESEWNSIAIRVGYTEATSIHYRGDTVEAMPATCTESGWKETGVCNVCGKHYSDKNNADNIIPALGHLYSEEYIVDIEPTCTVDGEKSKHCTREGCEAKDDVQRIDALGHDYVETTVAATCTEKGILTKTCNRCNDVITEEIPVLGHDFAKDYTVDKKATCTEEGEQSKHCTRKDCNGKEDIQKIPALGHDYVSKVTKESTCTEKGSLTKTCSKCGDVITEEIPALGHKFGEWKVTVDATVLAPEQQERICETCGTKETKEEGTVLTATAKVNATIIKLKVKQSTSGLKVTGLAKGDSVKTWKSTNTKIFTVKGKVNGTCKITAKKAGTAKLQITLASGLKKTVTVKVQKTAVKTTKVTVANTKVTVKKGKKVTLKPVVTPFTSKQKVTYTTSNKKIVTVSKNGVITGKKKGTAKVTVKSGNKSVKVTVKVK